MNIPVYRRGKRHHHINININNSLKFTIRRHRDEIKIIKAEAKHNIKQHKLLIKQAKITEALTR